jgi:hypothetical protein
MQQSSRGASRMWLALVLALPGALAFAQQVSLPVTPIEPPSSLEQQIQDAVDNGDLALANSLAASQFESVFTGSVEVSNSGCSDPNDNGSETGDVSVIFIDTATPGVQQGFGAFVSAADSSTFSLDVFTDSVSISGSVITDSGIYGLNGAVSGDVITFTFSGTEDPPFNCLVSGTGKLVKTSLATAITSQASATEVVTQQNLLTNTRAVISSVSSRITAIFGGIGGPRKVAQGLRYDGASGLAGGDLFSGLPFGVWGSYTRSDFEDRFAATAFDGGRNLAMGGFDISPTEDMVLGISAGFEGTELDTRFNSGSVESDGIIVSPYFAYRFDDTYQFDAIFGYTSVDTDQLRNITTAPIRSSTSSDRYFWSGNVTVSQPWGDFLFTGRGGLLWMREYVDGFTESNGSVVEDRRFELAQWRFGGDASYAWGDFEPFATLTYERDFSRANLLGSGVRVPGDDRDGVVVGAGIRYFSPAGITGSFEWNTVEGREQYSEDSFNFLLRGQF